MSEYTKVKNTHIASTGLHKIMMSLVAGLTLVFATNAFSQTSDIPAELILLPVLVFFS